MAIVTRIIAAAALFSVAIVSSAPGGVNAALVERHNHQARVHDHMARLSKKSEESAEKSEERTAWLMPPNGRKAGLAGGNAFNYMKKDLGWWYDWTAIPEGHSGDGTISVPMLWGAGHQGTGDATRLSSFKTLIASKTVPTHVLGFNEPDCTGSASADMTPQNAAALWKSLVAPMGKKGSLLGSPAMCMQAAETWLKPFEAALGGSRSWDFTAVHIYTDNMVDVKATINHFAQYGRPIWVTEFGCVHKGFTPCEDQSGIDSFIWAIVELFESDNRVHGYAYTDGGGLGTKWLPTVNGYGTGLSASGKTYSYAIAKYA